LDILSEVVRAPNGESITKWYLIGADGQKYYIDIEKIRED